MIRLNSGLTFSGECENAFRLYRSIFGGEFAHFVRFGEDPATAPTTAEHERDKVAYVALPIGDTLLEGDDTLDSSGIEIVKGNNVALQVHPDSKEEADRIFAALSSGGKVMLPLDDFPWGYCGALLDPFGVKWIVWHHPPSLR